MPIAFRLKVSGWTAPAAAMSPFPSVQLVPACTHCSLRQLCTPCASGPGHLPEAGPIQFSRRRLASGKVLFHEGEPFHAIHAVRSGSLKSTLVLPDGREQVVGFALPGDLLALDAISNARHASTVTAIEDSQVCALSYESILMAMKGRTAMQRSLSRELGLDILRAHRMMFLLGRLDAQQRLAAFLLDLSHRLKGRGLSAREFSLTMTRAEIGSFLGLTLETISRTLSLFQQQGQLSVHNRRIRIIDLESFAARFPAVLQG